jgi:hypothetical protein
MALFENFKDSKISENAAPHRAKFMMQCLLNTLNNFTKKECQAAGAQCLRANPYKEL